MLWITGPEPKSLSTPELEYLSAVALGRSPGRRRLEHRHGFSVGGHLLTSRFAGIRLAIQFLRIARRSAYLAQACYFDLELATPGGHLQHVSHANLTRRLGGLPVRDDPA